MEVLLVVLVLALFSVFVIFSHNTSSGDSRPSPYLTDEELQQRNAAFCERRDRATEILITLVREHSRTLMTKRHQLVTKNAYDQYEMENWINEMQYFCENIFIPAASKVGLDVPSLLSPDKCFIAIENELNRLDYESEPTSTSDITIEDLDPIEYEAVCAEILSSIGWSTRTTKGSGDQGVDIIAEKGDLKAVFQCKHYSNPVGNKAVQEVFAGKQHELADIAAVVTSSRFTKSAEELAHTCNVILLHHSQLEFFDEYLNEHV